jgi:sulfite reductase beta subunit-like hemoprotein
VAEIGLTGRIGTVDGRRTECYRLLAGGGGGRNERLAEELHACVPAARTAEAVRRLAEEYERRPMREETFGAFIRREKARLAATLAAEMPAG